MNERVARARENWFTSASAWCASTLGPRGFHCFDSSDMTGDRQLDWATANLAILNGRVIANRGVRTGRKPSSAVRTNHLDIFFEVHTNS